LFYCIKAFAPPILFCLGKRECAAPGGRENRFGCWQDTAHLKKSQGLGATKLGAESILFPRGMVCSSSRVQSRHCLRLQMRGSTLLMCWPKRIRQETDKFRQHLLARLPFSKAARFATTTPFLLTVNGRFLFGKTKRKWGFNQSP